MKRAVLLSVLAATSPALADDAKLTLTPVTVGVLGPVALDEAGCRITAKGTLSVMVTKQLDVKGAKFTAAHDCGASDEAGYLAISRGGDTFVVTVGTVEYSGAHMTDAPQHLSTVRDAWSTGTLADQSPAAVYRIDLSDANVCMKSGCGQDAQVLRQIIVACSVPTGTRPTPRCASVQATCDHDRCVAPTLVRGLLTISSGSHHEHRAIE